MNRLARFSLAVACTAVLLSTGCSLQAGTPQATPPPHTSAPPTEPPEPAVDTIELHAEEFQVFAGTDLVATLPLDDTTTSVAELTRLLGQPHTETVTPESTGNYCTIPHTSYDWGDALHLVDYESENDILSDYEVRIFTSTFVRSAPAEPIALRAAGAVTIGDDISAQLQSSPEMSESFESSGVTHSVLILEQGFLEHQFEDGAIFGVAAFTEDGIVDVIGSPIPIHSSADC